MGCHSPIQSKFPESMRFKDQKTIYNKVLAWQTPVKEGYAKVIADLTNINDMLKIAKLSTADRAQAQLYAEEARINAAKIKDDGFLGCPLAAVLEAVDQRSPDVLRPGSRYHQRRQQDRQEVIPA